MKKKQSLVIDNPDDLLRLGEYQDRLAAAGKKWRKQHQLMLRYGIEPEGYYQNQLAFRDLLFAVDADPEWLKRVKASHELDKAVFTIERGKVLAGDGGK